MKPVTTTPETRKPRLVGSPAALAHLPRLSALIDALEHEPSAEGADGREGIATEARHEVACIAAAMAGDCAPTLPGQRIACNQAQDVFMWLTSDLARLARTVGTLAAARTDDDRARLERDAMIVIAGALAAVSLLTEQPAEPNAAQ